MFYGLRQQIRGGAEEVKLGANALALAEWQNPKPWKMGV